MKMWLWPTAIAAMSGLALLTGLVGDKLWDIAATLLLSVPVIVAVRFGVGRR
ncbi:hypothetical protein [Methyloversatilis thermotolerans]|uniref:hypothetical protein n=1 Tax=Methyloversatilis thermotolerans TaxID=1346290 RepID=UPI000365DCE5|nr:hypothetical protein [Methyloversatilis thermotolerans]